MYNCTSGNSNHLCCEDEEDQQQQKKKKRKKNERGNGKEKNLSRIFASFR